MTDKLLGELGAMLDELCGPTATAAFTSARGATTDSPTRPGGWRVTPPPDAPFAALDIRGWDDDGIGIVDVSPRPSPEPDIWTALRARFGPFAELDQLDSTTSRFAASWTAPPGAAADVVLIVTLDDDDNSVVRITLRRDPRRHPAPG